MSRISSMRKTLLRTPETHARYEEAKRRGMDSSFFLHPDRKILSWGIVANNFPYDATCTKHDLLFPLRKVATRRELTEQEMEDYYTIIDNLQGYDGVRYNFPRTQSIPDWYHVHLLVEKLT